MKRNAVDILISLSVLFMVFVTTGCNANGNEKNKKTSNLANSQAMLTTTKNEVTMSEETTNVTTQAQTITTKETTGTIIVTTATATATVTTATTKAATTTGTTATNIFTSPEITRTSVVDNASTVGTTMESTQTTTNAQDVTTALEGTATESTTKTEKEHNAIVVEGYKDLPPIIQEYVNKCKNDYPGVHIGCGIFSLDGKSGFMYNQDEEIYSACTIKAPYAMYVLKECESEGIDIYETKLQYTKEMYNGGSGVIKDGPIGEYYSIDYLLNVLLKISDNTAYNILVSRFGIWKYQQFLNEFGGQNLYGSMYGRASARQRMNEWVEIVKYINLGSKYSQILKEDLTGTRKFNPNTGKMEVDPNGSQYCYLVEWMQHDHEYMHKSGWSWGDYMSACDCAVIDNQYLIVLMTADYATGLSRTDILRGFGYTVEAYVDSVGGAENLFTE